MQDQINVQESQKECESGGLWFKIGFQCSYNVWKETVPEASARMQHLEEVKAGVSVILQNVFGSVEAAEGIDGVCFRDRAVNVFCAVLVTFCSLFLSASVQLECQTDTWSISTECHQQVLVELRHQAI